MRQPQSTIVAAVLSGLCMPAAVAQEVRLEAAPAAAAPVQASPVASPVKREEPDKQPAAHGPSQGGQPSQAEQPKPNEKPGDSAPKTISRADVPRPEADPKEFNITPDEQGKIRFQFRGQSWPDVLDWLAQSSRMSLDWQELPADYLNLTTQRGYSIAEARDLINRHLLARGFTMLINDDVISVVKLEKLQPGLVPRVEPADLASRQPHEFVKVSLPLDWLLADQAVKELKPMMGPHGTLQPLSTTNRLEALDIVANLQEVYRLLREEQSLEEQEQLIREFSLQFVRAADVAGYLRELLGIKEEKPAGPMTPEQMQMMQQQRAMQQQQQQQQGQQPTAAAEEPKIYLVVNSRRNSLLVNAPPDKMAIIDQAIQVLDVPSDRLSSLILNPDRMQVYRLHSLNPEILVKTLEEVGSLDPTTHLEIDSDQHMIIAYASLADHMTIRKLVDRLDGSTRSFEVIRLRKLAADYVAGTIEFMMMGPEKEQSERPRYYFGYGYGRENEQDKDDDKFRVDADVENNFLLLWANEVEIQEVTNLLIKLGEIPPQEAGNRTLRVLQSVPPDQLPQLLDRLRRAWPSLAPNPLTLPPAESEEEQPPAKRRPDDLKDAARARSPGLRYALWQEKLLDPAEQPARENPPPVNISIGPDGEIVITSKDTRALNLLEELVGQLTPPRPDYEIFRLKFADAFYVKENLEEFFSEEDSNSRQSGVRYYFYDYAPQEKNERKYRLSQRPKLKFIYDYDSNSILVHGADAKQLSTIRELIALYDQPEPADSQSARITTVFQIRYSRAQTIAEAVKDVYRDLLSSNDKALAQNPEEKNRQVTGTTYIFNEDSNPQDPQRTPVTFKGKLSIGVDNLSNTLLVSAEGENLMRNITEMIESLDQAAEPLSTVSVVKLGGATNTGQIREVVARILAEERGAAAAVTPSATGPNNPPAANGAAPNNEAPLR